MTAGTCVVSTLLRHRISPREPTYDLDDVHHAHAEVRVHAERQARFRVAQVLGESLDVLPGVQEHRGVEVTERLHAARGSPQPRQAPASAPPR